MASSQKCSCCQQCKERISALENQVSQLQGRVGNPRRRRPRRPRGRTSSGVPRPSRSSRWAVTGETPHVAEYFELINSDDKGTTRGGCQVSFVKGDLVTADEEWKVHLVSGDMKRGAGVALDFAKEYGPLNLQRECYDVGSIKVQKKGNTKLINLVSKERFFHRISYDPETFLANFVASLYALKQFCVEYHVRRLAMVRLGANLNRTNWKFTLPKLLDVFQDIDIELVVYLRPWRRAARRPVAERDGAAGAGACLSAGNTFTPAPSEPSDASASAPVRPPSGAGERPSFLSQVSNFGYAGSEHSAVPDDCQLPADDALVVPNNDVSQASVSDCALRAAGSGTCWEKAPSGVPALDARVPGSPVRPSTTPGELVFMAGPPFPPKFPSRPMTAAPHSRPISASEESLVMPLSSNVDDGRADDIFDGFLGVAGLGACSAPSGPPASDPRAPMIPVPPPAGAGEQIPICGPFNVDDVVARDKFAAPDGCLISASTAAEGSSMMAPLVDLQAEDIVASGRVPNEKQAVEEQRRNLSLN